MLTPGNVCSIVAPHVVLSVVAGGRCGKMCVGHPAAVGKRDIHGPMRMTPNDFGDPLMFPVAPP